MSFSTIFNQLLDWSFFCMPVAMHIIEIKVETPKGSSVKYHYDKKNDAFTVKKVLSAGMVFPYDFGFVPHTKGEDGDALDALLLAEFGTFAGCRVNCRLVGCIQAEQTEGKAFIRNDRYLFVPEASIIFKKIGSIEQVPKELMDQLEHFFIAYNKAEGKVFKVVGLLDEDEAYQILSKAHARFID
jgi:inorganic pyrophosphatase